MNSVEFDALKIRIIERLQSRGAAKCETLAFELDVPQGNVLLALEQLSAVKEKGIQRLPFGLWDVNVETHEAA